MELSSLCHHMEGTRGNILTHTCGVDVGVGGGRYIYGVIRMCPGSVYVSGQWVTVKGAQPG